MELDCHKASKRTSDFPKDEDSITSSAVDEYSVSSFDGQAIEEECDLDSDSDDLTVDSDEEDALDDFGFSSRSQNTFCFFY